MKVIVAGFPKTGTKTMNAALSTLGYTVYDYEQNFFYLSKEWIKILTTGGTAKDFYAMYKDVDVSCDMPFCVFWEEISEAFPEAKIVFMRRKSEEDWLRSWNRQAKAVEENRMMTALPFFSPTAYSIFQYSQHVGRVCLGAPPQYFWQCYRGISPTVAKKRYRDHNTSVMERAPSDRLLVFSISDGWQPLCRFLGKPVPKTPFPHKNQRATLVYEYLKHNPIFHVMKGEMIASVTLLVVLSTAALVCLQRYRGSLNIQTYLRLK